MTTSHTPGPWVLSAGRSIETIDGTFYLGYFSDKATGAPGFRDFVALDHNARLIAAAPDMLAALQAINAALTQPVQFSGTDAQGTCNILRGDCQVAGSIARDAIAKATGGTDR